MIEADQLINIEYPEIYYRNTGEETSPSLY
jgi:hypothetical protein